MNNKRSKFLFRLLKENNCYQEFINNSNDNNISYFNNLYELLEYCQQKHVNEISNAFTWSDSVQGYEFWVGLNDKWLNILDKYFPETYENR